MVQKRKKNLVHFQKRCKCLFHFNYSWYFPFCEMKNFNTKCNGNGNTSTALEQFAYTLLHKHAMVY